MQHCHFVPHEDHGMMAFHEIMNNEEFYDDFTPMEANITIGKEYKNPDASTWIIATNYDSNDGSIIDPICDEWQGTSYIQSIDVNTDIYFYLSKFIYKGYCFLGIKTTLWLRGGHVDNAWLGLSMFGNSTNDYTLVSMTGEAFVFSLQTENNTGLSKLYVNEVKLEGYETNITNNIADSNSIKCQSNVDVIYNNSNQYAEWYCVRPMTSNYSFMTVEVENYTLANNKPFGYAWAYGEGRFQTSRMHSVRGTCAMYFSKQKDEQTAINGSFYCRHEGNVIEETNEATILQDSDDNGFLEFVKISTVNTSEFIRRSEFSDSYLPDYNISTSTSTVETTATATAGMSSTMYFDINMTSNTSTGSTESEMEMSTTMMETTMKGNSTGDGNKDDNSNNNSVIIVVCVVVGICVVATIIAIILYYRRIGGRGGNMGSEFQYRLVEMDGNTKK